MSCPKQKELEASHGKLGDLVSRYVPSWLPDGTAALLDDVVGEVSKYIKKSQIRPTKTKQISQILIRWRTYLKLAYN